MYSDYMQITIPIIGFIMNVFLQVISYRFIRRLGLLKSEFLGFTTGAIFVSLYEIYGFYILPGCFRSTISIFIVNFLIYSALGYCYFHFINLGETARRIRILRELYDSKTGLSEEEIIQRYNAKEIIKKRMARLISNHQVIYKDGKYYIGIPVVLFIAKVIVAMKRMLLGKESEFD